MTKSVTSQLIVNLIDGVSGPAAKAGAALAALQKRAGASIVAPVMSSVRQSTKALSDLRAAAMSPGLYELGHAVKGWVHREGEFEDTVNQLQIALNATDDQMVGMHETITRLATALPKMRTEIAEAGIALAKTGQPIDNVRAGLETLVKAAIAGRLSVDEVAKVTMDTVYTMGLRSTDAKEIEASIKDVTDTLQAAHNSYKQTYEEFGIGLSKALPIARMLGLTLTDTTKILGTLADEGFRGSRGGIAFASSAIRINSNLAAVRKELARYGIELSSYQQKTEKATFTGKNLADMLAAQGLDAASLVPTFDKILSDPKITHSVGALSSKLMSAVTEGLKLDNNAQSLEAVRELIEQAAAGAYRQTDFIRLLRDIGEKNAQNDAAFAHGVFGLHHSPAMVAFTNMLHQGGFDAQGKLFEEKIGGAVERGAKKASEGFGAAMRQMQSNLDALGESVFVKTGIMGDLTTAITKATKALDALRDSNPALLKGIGWSLIGIAGAAAAGMVLDGVASSLKILGVGARFAVGPIGRIALLLGALAYFKWDAIKAGWKDLSEGFSKGWTDNLKIPDNVYESWENLKRAVKETSGVSLDLPSWRELGETLGGVVAQGVNLLAAAFRHVCDTITAAIGLAKSAAGAFRDAFSHSGGSIGGPSDVLPGIPARASGGPVSRGSAYLVGEKGPELFVPSSSGGIVPNGAKLGGGSVTINAPINIKSAMNPAELKAVIERHISDAVNAALRGVQADYGLRWS